MQNRDNSQIEPMCLLAFVCVASIGLYGSYNGKFNNRNLLNMPNVLQILATTVIKNKTFILFFFFFLVINYNHIFTQNLTLKPVIMNLLTQRNPK